MEYRVNEPEVQPDNEQLDPAAREVSDRREFLLSLGKWSTAAIAAIVVVDSSPSSQATSWVNRRGSWADTSSRLEMAQQPRGRRQLG
jgi:hypothetical protein